jgi:phosphoglycolate phosphatase-like HAD superfamily hydrolase
MKAVIFDLDQTLVDSRIAEDARRRRAWGSVYPLIPQFGVYPGVDELLASLKGHARLAVVTSSPSSYCNRVTSWRRWQFDVAVCYHDSTMHKPHPEPLLVALRNLGVPASGVVSVGDHPDDVAASRAAGIVCVGAFWGTSDRAGLLAAGPNFACEDVAGLRETLSSLGMGGI